MQRFPACERVILDLCRRLRSRIPTLLFFMQMSATCFAIENCRKKCWLASRPAGAAPSA